jgi:8-amino-7-oxononanoate synthase
MNEDLQHELNEWEKTGMRRTLRSAAANAGRELVIDGRTLLNFSSNNYLDLAAHPAVTAAAAAAALKYGAGGTASRLISGTLDVHRELEEHLARVKQTPAALVFPSGYQANLAAVSALITAGDCLIMDRLNHASLWDAAKLSGARVFVYGHRDMNALERVLRRARQYRRKLVVTDTVFSMDGDCAPLREMVVLAEKYHAWTMVDEAHATGIFGARGGGLTEHCGLDGRIDVVMGTLSKALGSQGGFICGSRPLIDYLVNKGRSFIYSTALAPAAAAAANAALAIVAQEPERRARLLANAAALRDRLAAVGFPATGSESQIIPLVTGQVTETVSLSAHLWDCGIYAPAIRPPTVPAGACRLRFSLMSSHTAADIRFLVDHML